MKQKILDYIKYCHQPSIMDICIHCRPYKSKSVVKMVNTLVNAGIIKKVTYDATRYYYEISKTVYHTT